MRLTKQAVVERERQGESEREGGLCICLNCRWRWLFSFYVRRTVPLSPPSPSPNLNSAFSMAFLTVSCLVFVSWLFAWLGPARPGLAWPGPMVVRLSHCRFLHNKTTKLTVKCWSASHPPHHSPSLAPTVLCAVLPGKYLIWSKGFSCLSFSFVFFCFFPVLPLSTFLWLI